MVLWDTYGDKFLASFQDCIESRPFSPDKAEDDISEVEVEKGASIDPNDEEELGPNSIEKILALVLA